MNRQATYSAAALLFFVAALPAQEQGKPKVHKNLAYATGHDRQKLDLSVPENAKGKLPLVIWIHGGGWEGGSKDQPNPATPLLAKGYAVASINYRLSQHAVFPAQIQDCKSAVRWLRAHAGEYNLDAERFGVWGASAGGHLVALLGSCDETAFDEDNGKKPSARVQAVCDWFGPTDFLHWGESVISTKSPDPKSPIVKLFGGPVPQKMELATKASPVTHVAKGAAPFLIIHGDKDNLVPLQQSEVLHAALQKAGADSTLHVVKGSGHGGAGFLTAEMAAKQAAFFDKHLKK